MLVDKRIQGAQFFFYLGLDLGSLGPIDIRHRVLGDEQTDDGPDGWTNHDIIVITQVVVDVG